MELKEAYYPSRVPISSYGSGGFRFADISHKGSIMCLPSGIYAIEAVTITDLTPILLSQLFAESDQIDLVLFGVGASIGSIPKDLETNLGSSSIRYDIMDTGSACRTYNVLLAENRSISGVLLSID